MRLISSETSSVIILNYNGWKDTLRCLNKIESVATKPLRTIVVDNCSSDNSIEKILEYWQAPRQAIVIHESELQDLTTIPESGNILLVSSHNGGYAAGNNLGITLARLVPQCAAVWILNNDTEPDPMSLEYRLKQAQLAKSSGVLPTRASMLVASFAAPALLKHRGTSE